MSESSSEEERTAMEPGDSEVNVQSSVRKYMKTSEGLPMAVSTLDSSLKELAPELQDVVPSSHHTVQQNFIRVEVKQDVTMRGSANMTFGGTQNVSSSPPAYDNLLKRTVSKLDKWTNGIVETLALKKVMDKINKGVSWVTIKGCPGEGKTTTAHMALNELHKAGRKIFDVTTPEEFQTIVTSCQEHPVIMLDDVFGNLEFDKTEWSKWKQILLKTLEDQQHKDKQSVGEGSSDGDNSPMKLDVTVILVGREYVLNVCVSDLGKVADFFTHEKHVVNMSSADQRKFEEKKKIWKAISASSGIKLDDDTKRKICEINIPHGFPHVCKLFVTLRKKNPDLLAKIFFERPLEFLNETIQKFVRNKEKCNLFKAMLNHGGKITGREIEDLEDPTMVHVASDLVGTYLRIEDDCFKFDHPSIYDSVAYNMCTVATSFVIENCELNFILERIRLRKDKNSETLPNLVVSISGDRIPELATRFAREISESNLSQSLCHQAFTDAEFVTETMSRVTVDLRDLVKKSDKTVGQRFLVWLSSSRSPELLKYVRDHYDLSQTEYDTILYGVCLFAATDVLCYMEQNKLLANASLLCFSDRENHAMIAARGRNKSFVNKIMSLNPDVHTRNISGQTLLHLLVLNGLTEAVEKVIENGADVNSKDKSRYSPLAYACREGNEDIVKILLEKGAHVDSVDEEERTPLEYACRNNHENIVELLIKKGANVNLIRVTPLWYACQNNNENIVQILIKAGASIDVEELSAACQTGNVNLVELLVQKTSKIDIPVNKHAQLMTAAVESGNVKMVKWLNNHGISVNDPHGQPLHSACRSGLSEIARVLLESGADINAKDSAGNTPLHVASSDKCFNVLLKCKPNLLAKNQFHQTVLHTAASRGLKQSVNTLIQEQLDVEARNHIMETPLFCASRKGSSDCVKLLIDAGVDVNVKSVNGNTPLHEAIPSVESARLLVQAGASVNVWNNNNYSPLSFVFAPYMHVKDMKIVEFFIQNNADVNVRDNEENTLLHLAAMNKLQLIPLLLDAGVDPRLTNVEGKTPLHLLTASCWDNAHRVSVIKELIKHGANVNSQDAYGNVPLHHWRGIINTDVRDAIIDVLVKSGADGNIRNCMNERALPQESDVFHQY